MAWNQPTTNNKIQSMESEIKSNLKSAKSERPKEGGQDVVPSSRRPKCVAFAFWWFIVTGIIAPVDGFMDYFAKSLPWTMCAISCGIGLLMIDCARMISKRNMVAVFLATLTLFFTIWLVGEIQPAIFFSLPPMILLVLPHSIRWLRLNNRFSVSALIGSVFVALSIVGLNFKPSITDVVISNANPLSVVVPGDKAKHKLNEDYQHEYWYMRHGRGVGRFVAQYNQNAECFCVKLHIIGARFWEIATDICNERFDGGIWWSNAVTVKGVETEGGLPMLCGTVDKKIIMIFPYKYSSGGALLICDSQLNSELDFLFALPDENALISQLNYFLDNRARLLSVELDDDEAQHSERHDIYEGLLNLRNQARVLYRMTLMIAPLMTDIETPRVARIVEEFELRRKTLEELAMIIWSAAHNAVTAIEYNTRALAMPRSERIQLRREYLENESAPVPDELLPIDPKDHSGQNRIFDKDAKQFKEGREALYCALHKRTGYNLGRPYNAAADQGASDVNKQDKPGESKAPSKSRYGEGLPDTYGGNKHLFYRTGYGRGLVDDEVEDAHKQDKPAESKEPQIVGARLGPSRHSESVKAQHAARAKAEQQAIAARNARNAGKTGFDNYDDLSDSQRRRRDQALEDRKAKFFESTGYGRP